MPGHQIPIIFITAFTDESTRVQALEAGAIGYLIKPLRRLICWATSIVRCISAKPRPARVHRLSRSFSWLSAQSVIAGDRADMRGGAIGQVEHHLVDVAPPPAFGRVIAFDDRVARLVKMLGGVAVRRVVATADIAAGPAEPQMQPWRTDL